MEKPPNPNIDSGDRKKLKSLADQLVRIANEKTQGKGDVVIDKLIKRLMAGDAESAKIFCNNEFDKFMAYREDALPLIIEELYGGSGSPWFSIERKLKQRSQDY